MFLKWKNDKTDPYLGLLNLRNTPISTSNMSYSPAMLLMGRRCLTKLSTNSELLKPKLIDHELYKEYEIKSKEKQKYYYDKGTKDLPKIIEGQNICFKKPKSKKKHLWLKVKL